MNVETREVYSEVYQVINLLGSEYREKLPKSFIETIEEKRDINYNPQLTDEMLLSEQNVHKETMHIITLLYLNYWCSDEKEVLEIKKRLQENEYKYQAEIREKYNPDNIFKKPEKEIIKEEIIDENNEEKAVVEYKKSFIVQILNKIKKIFQIKK